MKYLKKEHNWNIHVKNKILVIVMGILKYLLACCNGHLEIMKYLEKKNLNLTNQRNTKKFLKKNIYSSDAYLLACCNGHFFE